MKKYLLAASFTLIATGAHAEGIYGNWIAPPYYQASVYVTNEFTFASDSMTFAVTCTYPDGVRTHASVTSTADFTSDTVIITENPFDEHNEPGHECAAMLNPDAIHYDISGGQLTITDSDGSLLVLNRKH